MHNPVSVLSEEHAQGDFAKHSAAPHTGYAETWAKAILMGEHSVVYGYPAIAMPLQSLRMRARVQPNGLAGVTMINALGYSGPIADAGSRFAGIAKAVEVAKRFAGCIEYGFTITTRSDFPAGRGLGSSAAASGAVIRAVLDSCDVNAGLHQLLSLTNEAEKVTHGHPSGLDAFTTSGDHTVVFGKGHMQQLGMAQSGYLVIADSGIIGSTREAVQGVSQQFARQRERTSGLLAGLGDLATEAISDLEHGGLQALGKRMNQAHDLLDKLQVSHPAVNRLVCTARHEGALGAKMTGGGLGGCIVALTDDRGIAARVHTALLADGAAEAWIHPLDMVGE